MKVCILTTGYPRYEGDISNIFVYRLAKSLGKKEIELHVVAPHARGVKKEEMMEGIYVHRFHYMYPEGFQTLAYFPGIPEKIKTLRGKAQLPLFMLSMIKKTIYVASTYDIDIINAHWAIPSGFIATFTKIFHNKPVLITLYGAELWPAIKKNSKVMKWLISYSLSNADKVVGISDATCNVGAKISGKKDIEVLPDGIDVETFNPQIDGEKIRSKHNLGNHFLIYSSGRMVERKGFRYLVEAMPFILEKFPNTMLIISGDGPERKNLEDITENLNIKDNILFPGFIPNEDFPKHMKACDVFVLPSIVDSKGDTEGSATILLEAMACGTPVVGTRVGGVPFAIRDGLGGYLVEQKDSEQLAERITVLLKDNTLREEFGQKGRRYVEDKFSCNKIAERYIEEFEGLAKR